MNPTRPMVKEERRPNIQRSGWERGGRQRVVGSREKRMRGSRREVEKIDIRKLVRLNN